jgi:hypothetical protein
VIKAKLVPSKSATPPPAPQPLPLELSLLTLPGTSGTNGLGDGFGGGIKDLLVTTNVDVEAPVRPFGLPAKT